MASVSKLNYALADGRINVEAIERAARQRRSQAMRDSLRAAGHWLVAQVAHMHAKPALVPVRAGA